MTAAAVPPSVRDELHELQATAGLRIEVACGMDQNLVRALIGDRDQRRDLACHDGDVEVSARSGYGMREGIGGQFAHQENGLVQARA